MKGGMSSVHVFLTRPEGRNGSVPGRLRAASMRVTEIPALELRPLTGHAVPDPGSFDLVVFVSRYAVQRFFQLWNGGADASGWPVQTFAAAVGASTANALRAAGVPSACLVHPPASDSDQDSEALVRQLDARRLQPKQVLIVRGTDGRPWLGQTLAVQGAHVEFLPLYERVPANWNRDLTSYLQNALNTQARNCIFLLTSSDGVRAMARRLRELGVIHNWSDCAFVVIHERIAATLQSELAPHRIEELERLALCTPDDDAIVEAIHAVAGPTAEP